MDIITTGPLHGRKIEQAYLSKGLHAQYELLFPPAFYDEFRRSQNRHARRSNFGPMLILPLAPLRLAQRSQLKADLLKAD
jgi:hypothetical protein